MVKNLVVKRLVVKNPPANIGDIRNTGLIPELGRSPGRGHGKPFQGSFFFLPYSNILAWRIPRTEEPGGLQFIGSHRVGHD